MKWLLASFVALILALAPGTAFAEEGDDLLLRVNGDVFVPADQVVGAIIVIDGNAVIEGTVKETVLVIDGNATIGGSVEGDITVIEGNLNLLPSARVDNVNLVRGELNQAPGATVTGEIHEREDFEVFGAAAAVFGILFWLALTIAILAAGLVFAAIGGRQLTEAAQYMTSEAVGTIVGIVFVFIALPILAVLIMITLIGIPLGLAMILFVLPALWFLGYIVAGARLGGALVGLTGREVGVHPYLATFVGLLLLQLLVLVPVLGALVAFLAGVWGAGALAYLAFRAAGGRGLTPATPVPREQPQPPTTAQPTA
jgi:hypothetical protein